MMEAKVMEYWSYRHIAMPISLHLPEENPHQGPQGPANGHAVEVMSPAPHFDRGLAHLRIRL